MGYRTYTCPIARRCGGCEWLSVPYPIQLRRKQEAMDDLFAEICQVDGIEVAPIRGMDDPRAFRHKAACPYAPGAKGQRGGRSGGDGRGRGGKGQPRGKERMRAGFYEAGTHRIVWCKKCLVEDPRARAILNDVAHVADRLGIPAYAEDRGEGLLRNAVVRCGWQTEDILLTIVTNGKDLPRARQLVSALLDLHPEVTSIVQNVNDRRTNAILGRENRTLYGPGIMHDRLLGCTFEIGPTSFYQTNPAQTQVLYRLAIQAADLRDGDRVLDAYCGTGTIGLCLADGARARGLEGVRVTGVDSVGNAISCARRNARANRLRESCDFLRDDATDYMVRTAGDRGARGGTDGIRKGQGFDVVVMDPPRAGSTPDFLAALAYLAPRRVVYVSCNPKTQVRDIYELGPLGYRVDSIEPVDMFPHTKHVETVVSLSRLS